MNTVQTNPHTPENKTEGVPPSDFPQGSAISRGDLRQFINEQIMNATVFNKLSVVIRPIAASLALQAVRKCEVMWKSVSQGFNNKYRLHQAVSEMEAWMQADPESNLLEWQARLSNFRASISLSTEFQTAQDDSPFSNALIAVMAMLDIASVDSDDIINKVDDACFYAHRVLALHDGSQNTENLKKMIQQTCEFAKPLVDEMEKACHARNEIFSVRKDVEEFARRIMNQTNCATARALLEEMRTTARSGLDLQSSFRAAKNEIERLAVRAFETQNRDNTLLAMRYLPTLNTYNKYIKETIRLVIEHFQRTQQYALDDCNWSIS